MKQNFDYRGSIILGIHDAIVSLTGLIAGLFFAVTDKNIIVLSCIIASVSASLSMGAANYLAVKTTDKKSALYAALFTSGAYMLTCFLLILPFFMFSQTFLTVLSIFITVIFIIFLFNFFAYNKKDFFKNFIEMLVICAIVSFIAFLLGNCSRYFLGI